MKDLTREGSDVDDIRKNWQKFLPYKKQKLLDIYKKYGTFGADGQVLAQRATVQIMGFY